jgi:hypothetical protein
MNEEHDIRAALGHGSREATSPLPAVCLCRHGETLLNAGGRLRGHSNPDLDATGRQQADALGMSLRPASPLAILSSPVGRALHTAEAIARACGLTVDVNDDLIDQRSPHRRGHGDLGIRRQRSRYRALGLRARPNRPTGHKRPDRPGESRCGQLGLAGLSRSRTLAGAQSGPPADRMSQHPPAKCWCVECGHCGFATFANHPSRARKGFIRLGSGPPRQSPHQRDWSTRVAHRTPRHDQRRRRALSLDWNRHLRTSRR